MEQNLQTAIDLINENALLSEEEKAILILKLKEADKKITITEFKLDRTEKVKRTTAILLEETIAELEQKRKAAEAQNRELEIEASLERVRTVAMSMKQAADMLDVCKTISEQLQLLHVKEIRNVQTAIFYKEKGTYMNYEYYAKHDKAFITETSYTNNRIHLEFAEKMLKGNGEFMIAHINGDEVKEWIAYQKTTNVFIDEYLNTASSLNYYWFSLGPVALGISTYDPLKEEDINLFKRFLKVFELAYRRYLDIEQAEAQTLEAKIEAALEKVRSRSLAVHKSDEFNEVIKVVFERLQELKIPMTSVSINVIIEGSKDTEAYICGSGADGLTLSHIRLIHFDHPIANDRYNAYKNGLEFFTKTYNKEDKNSFFKYEFEVSDLKNVPDDIKKMVFESKSYTISSAFAKHSMIVVNDFEGNLLSSKEIDIVKRFSRVFEQAYIRFLDLQKAEAQANEAQIELALERVRAKTMAMQKSSEFVDVINIIGEQFVHLGFDIDWVNFGANGLEISEGIDIWNFVVIPGASPIAARVFVPYFDHPVFTTSAATINEFINGGKDFITVTLDKQAKDTWLDHLFTKTIYKDVPEEYRVIQYAKPGYTTSNISLKDTWLSIGKFDIKNFTDEQHTILRRFANAFGQAYTRFLDLEKAEAQARESQIQLALERARAQSMMMQHSTELDDTLRVFHEQVLQLNISSAFSFLWLPDEDKDRHIFWAAWKENNLFKSKAIDYPLDRNEPATAQCLIDWKSNEPVVSYHVPPAGVANYFAAWSELIAGVEQLKPEYFSEGLYYVEAFMKYGCFGVMTSTDLMQDEKKILERFATEFERVYTRFLDLQKAEAQTRESQIQLALERVRARTMAMQRSDELADTAAVLFSQFKNLGYQPGRITIGIMQEEKQILELWATSGEAGEPKQFYQLPFNEPHVLAKCVQAWKEQKKSLVLDLSGQPLKEYTEFWKSLGATEDARSKVEQVVFNFAFFSKGYLGFISFEHAPPQTIELLERFAGVFDLTYTRFLDLQKAEAQARENQIQLALERVRARTMAMQKSDELADVATLLFKQVNDLKIKTWTTGFNIWSDDNNAYEDWIASPAGGFIEPYVIDATVFSEFKKLSDAKKSGTDFFILYQEGETLQETYNQLSRFANKNQFEKILEEGFQFPSRQFVHMVFGSKVSLMFITYDPVPEAYDVFKRFGKVFEQTYTRFLDLQKAEAQAREAQIELGLERVRARAMAMQTSEELNPLIGTVFTELTKLDILLTRCVILIYEGNEKGVRWWMANSETPSTPMNFFVKYADMPFFNEYLKGWYNRELKWQYCLEDENKIKTDGFLFNETELSLLPDFVIEGMKAPNLVYLNASFNNFGNLTLATLEPLSEEHFNILLRFAKVFDLTYTRFNDLKQAEAQARESQIQLALERVRARTMAMQTSDELADVATLLFKQVNDLGIKPWTVGFNIWTDDNNAYEDWIASPAGGFIEPYVIDATVFSEFKTLSDAKKSGTEVFILYQEGELLKETYKQLSRFANKNQFEKILEEGFQFPSRQFVHMVFGSKVSLMFITYDPVPEAYDVFKRFGKVFEQTYTRFLDLQRAEAQAREAQIETSLERVRAIAMSMMKSDELMSVCEAVFKQLEILGFTDVRAAQIYIRNDAEEKFLNYDYSDISGADVVEVSYNSHPNTRRIYDVIKNAGDALVHNMIEKKELDAWKSYLYNTLAQPPEKNLDKANELHYYLYSFGTGAFGICIFKPITENELQILKRFRNVFSLSYQRYTDIAQAEAQAKESQIEAALERVRSRTLAMQKSDELAETSAVLFKQLISLGIEPNRLYISIMKDDEGETEFWITDEDGSKVSSAYTDNLNANASFKKMYDGWKAGRQSMIIDMKGKELEEYFQHLTSLNVPFKDGLKQKRRIQHLAFFNRGFIGMAAPDDQPEETIHLLERFAAVFNLTFTRFNDLKIAEAHAVQAEHDLIEIKAARKKAEETLVELQSAQKQLIQSEKMASLGELTAGIAHEIQNPLNFVNNFSEVSDELLDEVKEELATGNLQLATQIIDDIKQNLEKINHHGKRADAIVKGMLQHSRQSKDVKEPTDINALCDEYLRLCFHGLRAKDKSFNSNIQTDFDSSIEKINIVPQNIGRVVLNILTNAFYAVNEKKKTADENYQPTVLIQTKKINDTIEIKITDNGNGIPRNIIDKIFQPFFTTKPTGEGTGLGLSLSYDIIKAHGGEIKVETKIEEGTIFIIQLPIA